MDQESLEDSLERASFDTRDWARNDVDEWYGDDDYDA
jgi:hypothetical protein